MADVQCLCELFRISRVLSSYCCLAFDEWVGLDDLSNHKYPMVLWWYIKPRQHNNLQRRAVTLQGDVAPSLMHTVCNFLVGKILQHFLYTEVIKCCIAQLLQKAFFPRKELIFSFTKMPLAPGVAALRRSLKDHLQYKNMLVSEKEIFLSS